MEWRFKMIANRMSLIREFEEWVNTPVPRRMIIRLMPAVYNEQVLPEDIKTDDEAMDYACDFAKEHGFRLCLVLSRKISVWIDNQGDIERITRAVPGEPNHPYMMMEEIKEPFLLNIEENNIDMNYIDCPGFKRDLFNKKRRD